MSITKFIRDVQSRHEAIPAPGALIYNVTAAKVLRGPERKIVGEIASKISSGVILDLGCGTGYLSIEIGKRAPRLRVYGIDLSWQMVKIATRLATDVPNVSFQFGNAAELPFADDSLDFIVSTGSLHHWKRPERVFQECYRVLKGGKEAWIYDPCADSVRQDAAKIRRRRGFLGYGILIKITELHGFSKSEYESRIGPMVDQSAFGGSYQMELADIWMKITLRKARGCVAGDGRAV